MRAEPLRPRSLLRLRALGALAAALLFIGASTYVSQWVWMENGLRSIQAVNEQRVQLVGKALLAEIGRQDHLPVVMSLDSDVVNALAEPDNKALVERLNRKLRRVSDEAATRGLYVIAANGIALAADDWEKPGTRVGQDLSGRPYFQNAMKSGKSALLGVETSNDPVRYHVAEAVHRGKELLGVVVVRIEFDSLEAAWQQAGERVLIADADGFVFLSSGSEFQYRFLSNVAHTPAPSNEVTASHYHGEASIEVTVLETRGENPIVRVVTERGRNTYQYQSMSLPNFDWTVHRFADLTAVHTDQRDGAIIGATISTLMIFLLLIVTMRHRALVVARAAGVRLKAEVAERTRELQDANNSLKQEIDERRRTETRLRTTQNELVQAGKLAGLGQMSATIAHEINQPLAAIRTFMASTKIFAERGNKGQIVRNLDIVDNLAERMANITAHLKVFARKSESGHSEPVDVMRAVEGALFLVESRIKSGNVSVEIDKDFSDIWVSGNAVQLEQVMVNLISNALDAIADAKAPRIGIRVWVSGELVSICVADNGPGIAQDVINRMFDPFTTTKSVGKGLGLGLSISYGIVQDFKGRIFAANRPQGGAELIIELPRLAQEAVSAPKVVHV